MVTFFEAGTFTHKELSVTVDKPCILMIKDITSKSANLHIADPGQTQSPIQVELKIGKKNKHSLQTLLRRVFMQEPPNNTL